MQKTNINPIKYTILPYLLTIALGVFVLGQSAEAKEINTENIIELVNQSRQENNLSELMINPILNKVAEKKATHMIENHYFAHYSPDGLDPWHWFKEVDYDYRYAGENLAINYKTAASQQIAWMKSPTHRKNILNPAYTETGVATASGYIDNKLASITVQVFGTPQKALSTNLPASSVVAPQQSIVVSSNVLGKELQASFSTQYLNSANSKSTQSPEARFSFNKTIFNPIKQHSQNIIWTAIVFLFIVLIRDIVIKSINLPTATNYHRPSITNLVILIMLWSVFIGL